MRRAGRDAGAGVGELLREARSGRRDRRVPSRWRAAPRAGTRADRRARRLRQGLACRADAVDAAAGLPLADEPGIVQPQPRQRERRGRACANSAWAMPSTSGAGRSSGRANCASSATTRRSHASASAKPAPPTQFFDRRDDRPGAGADRLGELGQTLGALQARGAGLGRTPRARCRQKWAPSPHSTMQRTPGSDSATFIASMPAAASCSVRRLRVAGALKVSTRVAPRRSVRSSAACRSSEGDPGLAWGRRRRPAGGARIVSCVALRAGNSRFPRSCSSLCRRNPMLDSLRHRHPLHAQSPSPSLRLRRAARVAGG